MCSKYKNIDPFYFDVLFTTHCFFIMIPFLLSLLSTLNVSLAARPEVAVVVCTPGSGRRIGSFTETCEVCFASRREWLPDPSEFIGNRLSLRGIEPDREGPNSLLNGLRNAPSEENVHAMIAKSSSNCLHADVTALANVGSEAVISFSSDRRWKIENGIVLQ